MNGAVTVDTNDITATSQPTSAITTTVGGAQTAGSGASFWDVGTLAVRLQAGIGTRVLSAVEGSLAWASPSYLAFGDLNLLGLTNPLGYLVPKALMYGAVAGWTADPSIAWGTSIQDPQGAAIMWGRSEADAIVWDMSDGDAIVWDMGILTAPDPR
jgi:hypothetical protein